MHAFLGQAAERIFRVILGTWQECYVNGNPDKILGEPVPDAGREADAGEQDGADHDAGLQLVQEQETEGPDAVLGCGKGGVSKLDNLPNL